MNPIVTSYTIIMIVAAMVCMVIIVYVWPHRRKNPETLPLLLLLVGITEWICAALLGMLDPNLSHKILWAKIEYIGVVSVPLAVLVFVLHHSGIQQWLSRKRLAWLVAIPAITLLLAWTNEFHRLIWARYIPYLQGGLAFSDKAYGPAFWVYWGYSYLLLLAATVLTVRVMLASPRIFRWQSILVAVGILAPWAANLFYILHIDPIKNLDLTPLAFGFTGVSLAFGMFRWQLFDIKPFAQAAVISGMADGLMILDNQGRVLDVNPAAQVILSQKAQALIGKPVEEIIANRLAPEERSRWMAEEGLGIRLLSGNEPRDYELSDSPFYEKGGALGGRIIFLHDITERKRLEERLREAQRKQVEGMLHENEQRLASIYDTVGDAIYYLAVEPEEQYRFDSVNRAFGKVIGLPAELVIGRKVTEIIPEPSLSLVLGKYRQAIREKTVVRWEETSDYLSGKLTGEASIAPVLDQAGNCTHLVGTVHDVTERRQAEMAILASEQQLKSYIESAGDAIYVIETKTGRIQNCNERACHDLGYNKDELLQLSSQDIEFKLSASEVDTIHHELQLGEVTTIDGMHRRKDGSGFPVEIRLSSLAPAQPECMLAIVRDITERKQFEEKLQKSEARYQLIFENSGTANTIFDTGCRVILQNSQSQKLTSPADALGKTALEVFGTEQGPIVHARMVRVLASGVPSVFETKFSMPAGERWIRSSYQPLLDEQQGLVGIQVISQDISPQKQAEELLRETSERLTHMLANSPTIIYALKVAGDQATPVWISENIQTVLGFRAEAAMQPAWWLGQVHPEDCQTVQASLEHLFDDFYQHEYHFLCKDGRVIWLHDEHRLLRNVDNMPREIIGAWTDITERKQAEEALRDYNIRLALDVVERTRELKDAQEKLVRQEKLAVLGQLAGGVGHELRNPLAVINNAIYYLKLIQPDADEKVRKYHSMIEHEVHNSEKIITDLLDFARVKSVDREELAVPELVQRVLERFPVPESIKAVLEFSPGLPKIYADLRQMEQVLGNLVVNACQAMVSTSSATLAEGGTLTISANQEKDLVAIAVKDTGSGITPENMQKLFEPLFTTKPKGIGLGLVVSRKLAEANGGCIEVQSEVGKGSTFTLYLPVSR